MSSLTSASPLLAKYAWRALPREGPQKRAATDRIHDFGQIYSLLDDEAVQIQASRCVQCANPLCMTGCPLKNRIPEWLGLTADGKFLEAAAVSRSTSNMPEICSRVCPQERLCEAACVLNAYSDPVCIGAVERFINERAFAEGDVPIPYVAGNGRSVAIIGSGPGGLACADELARHGFSVTIFERQATAGGLLTNGIPAFKLEKEVVARRVELLRQLGVHLELRVGVGQEISFNQLRKDFRAIFLASGAQQPKPLGIPGAELSGVYDALPFLSQKNAPGAEDLAQIDVRGKHVAVLGGGDTAMDCLRTALRAGASTAVCLYRRDLANMPGNRREYSNALEEGAKFSFLTNPIALQGEGGAVRSVRCVRMQLGDPDAQGRRKPKPVPNSEFDVPADVVLVAFGFDSEPFPAGSELSALQLNEWGGVVVNRDQMTSLPGVFAGGDLVRGPSLVVHAVLDGRRAALGIERYAK